MRIPLPKGLRGSQVLPKEREYLLNMANIGGKLVSRPAVEAVTAQPDEPRGQFVFQGVLFSIFGDKIYYGTGLTLIATTIDGVGPVAWDVGFSHAMIVTGTIGANYKVEVVAGVPSVTAVLAAKTYVDVAFIAGRFVYIPENGDPAEWSEVGDGSTVGPNYFFDAEEQPDENEACVAIGGTLHIMGADTIQPFRPGGPTNAPFLPLQGATIEVGFVGAKVKTTDSCIFLGKPKGGGYGFFLFANGGAQRISDQVVDELLEAYTPAQLAAVRAQRFFWRGAEWFTFVLPDRTLSLVNGQWGYVDSGVTGVAQLGRWLQYNATLYDGVWYVQSAAGLNKLSRTTFKDSTGKFSRQIVTFARSSEEDPLDVGEIEVGHNNGVGVGSVGISVSDDGAIWTDVWYRDRAAVGNREQKLVFNPAGGFGMFDDYMGICLYTTDNLEFAVDALVAR